MALIAAYIPTVLGTAQAVAAVGTAAVIATAQLRRMALVAWLGSISYSLYLVHEAVGMPVMQLAARFGSAWMVEILAVSLSIAVALVSAAALHALVERPALRLASMVSYRRHSLA